MVSAPLSPSSRERSGEARFEALPDSVPPQNLEAEEAVLGGILLDPDAIGRVADVLRPEAFYLTAHREIYRTALMLHGQGKPTDLTAMTAWLADTGQLEKVVIEQMRRMLHTPEVIAETCRKVRAQGNHTLSEGEISGIIGQLDTTWEQLFPAEQTRLVRLLVQKVIVSPDGVRLHDKSFP